MRRACARLVSATLPPCAGWLPRTSSGKPRSPSATPGAYAASLRKVGLCHAGPLRRLAAPPIAGQAEIALRAISSLHGEPAQGWFPLRWPLAQAGCTAHRRASRDRSPRHQRVMRRACARLASAPLAPCAGWLHRTSPGKPRSPSATSAPYTASLRKVGFRYAAPLRRLAAPPIAGQAEIALRDTSSLCGEPAQGWRFSLHAQPSQGCVDITTPACDDVMCL